jgi:Tol biopolymer transport system component
MNQRYLSGLPYGLLLIVFAVLLAISFLRGLHLSKIGRIAYSSHVENAHADIFLTNTAGNWQKHLTKNSFFSHFTRNLKSDFQPTWSPDDSHIAFVSRRGRSQEIFVMKADGTDEQQLTDNRCENLQPAWSPDGKQIAFIHSSIFVKELYPGKNEEISVLNIYLMNSDGSGQVRITNGLFDHTCPKWLPDGKHIIYTDWHDIWIMNADGAEPTELTNTSNASWPSVSQDGKHIAFVSYKDGNGELFTMNVDGSGVRQLTDHLKKIICEPTWSPDGIQIAFKYGDGLSIVNVESGKIESVKNKDFLNNVVYNDPAWSHRN